MCPPFPSLGAERGKGAAVETISIREAAERLGVSHKVVRRLVAQGIVQARKEAGGHGEEWRLDVDSVEAYRSGAPATPPPPPRPKPAPPPDPTVPALTPPSPQSADLEADKRFLQEQVTALTDLLRAAIARGPSAPSGIPSPGDDAPSGAPALREPDALAAGVTQALQISLSSLDVNDIRALEMCSVRLLWGKPVLWRVVAEEPADVSALLEAILSPEAAWDPPAGEVVFLWARDAGREVVWGTACGPAWFGAPFQEALRQARVERR